MLTVKENLSTKVKVSRSLVKTFLGLVVRFGSRDVVVTILVLNSCNKTFLHIPVKSTALAVKTKKAKILTVSSKSPGRTPLYGLSRHVRAQSVWFFSRFGQKKGIDLAILVLNRVWFLYSSLEILRMFFRRSYFFHLYR